MLTHTPKIPGWIAAEIKYLAFLTEVKDLERLRERRKYPTGVKVDIYHHYSGSDSYFCDVRKKFFRLEDIKKEAESKVETGRYLFTAVLEYEVGARFLDSSTNPYTQLN